MKPTHTEGIVMTLWRRLAGRPDRATGGLAAAIGLALALSASAAAPPATGTTPAAPDEARTLAGKLLANPGDTDTRARLAALRTRGQQDRIDALDALALGLEAHLDGQAAQAAPNLQKALQCPYAVMLANSVLSTTTLADLARPYTARSGSATPSPATTPAGGVCPKCGGLGWVDCTATACMGSGTKNCSTCRGTGLGAPNRMGGSTIPRPCNPCNGSGAEKCPTCNGNGTLGCDKCGGAPPAGPATATGPSRSVEEIRTIIVMARYLRDGGLDLYSRTAKECSPKIAGTAGATGGPGPRTSPTPTTPTPPAPAPPARPSGQPTTPTRPASTGPAAPPRPSGVPTPGSVPSPTSIPSIPLL